MKDKDVCSSYPSKFCQCLKFSSIFFFCERKSYIVLLLYFTQWKLTFLQEAKFRWPCFVMFKLDVCGTNLPVYNVVNGGACLSISFPGTKHPLTYRSIRGFQDLCFMPLPSQCPERLMLDGSGCCTSGDFSRILWEHGSVLDSQIQDLYLHSIHKQYFINAIRQNQKRLL